MKSVVSKGVPAATVLATTIAACGARHPGAGLASPVWRLDPSAAVVRHLAMRVFTAVSAGPDTGQRQ